jgi:HK97 family phage portal protein
MPNPLTRPLALPWDGALRAASRKAASIVLGPPRRWGHWLGDPVSGGVWVDGSPFGGYRGTGTFNYAAAVGRGDTNSVVVGCLRALQRAAPEPPPRVYRPDAQGEYDAVEGRPPLARLLARPNPTFSRRLLAAWEVACLHLDGNAYYAKIRSGAGRVVALEPLPPWQIAPVPGGSTARRIRHYAYQPDAQHEALALPVEDVLHLRLELDPDDPTRGRTPLRAVLKHVFTDEEATEFCNALLRNFANPAVVFTPDAAAAAGGLTQESVEKAKAGYMQRMGGTHRGEPLFLTAPWKVHTPAFSPQQMLLDKLQELPESRVCSAMGVPPIMAYFQIGLAHATYSNADQFQEGFVKNTLVPYWALVQEQYTFDLIPEFYGEDAEEEVRFDLTEVGALQEDEGQKVERYTKAILGGWAHPNEGRRAIGLPDWAKGDVVYLPQNVTPTEVDKLIPEPEPEPEALPMPEFPAEAMPAPPPPNGRVPERERLAAAAGRNGRAR